MKKQKLTPKEREHLETLWKGNLYKQFYKNKKEKEVEFKVLVNSREEADLIKRDLAKFNDYYSVRTWGPYYAGPDKLQLWAQCHPKRAQQVREALAIWLL